MRQQLRHLLLRAPPFSTTTTSRPQPLTGRPAAAAPPHRHQPHPTRLHTPTHRPAPAPRHIAHPPPHRGSGSQPPSPPRPAGNNHQHPPPSLTLKAAAAMFLALPLSPPLTHRRPTHTQPHSPPPHLATHGPACTPARASPPTGLGFRVVSADDRDSRACVREPARDPRTDAAVTDGDDRDFTAQIEKHDAGNRHRAASYLPKAPRRRVTASRVRANGKRPIRADEMTGVAGRIVLEVVLMLRLGFPEIPRRRYFGHDLARPQA